MGQHYKKIIFYNYKIISELKTAKGIWWLEDNIREKMANTF